MSSQSPSTYGRVPTTSSTTTTTKQQPLSTFITPAKSHTQTLIATRRPWRELFDLHSFSRPHTYAEAMSRIRRSLNYFRVNYAMAILLILFLSLVYHPFSIIFFLIVFFAWFFLYFFRNDPIVLFNKRFDDRVVLAGLSLITVIALVVTHVGLNVLVSLVIGVVVVGLHAAFRVTEDQFLDCLLSETSENEELRCLEQAPPFWKNRKKLSKQMSMCEMPREIAWERRQRRQIVRQVQRRNSIHDTGGLTDEDLNELKGSIELGFGFNEEDGQELCNTLPALDLYFAVNRQYSTSPVSSPGSRGSLTSLGGSSMSLERQSSAVGSPGSESDPWKICSPGDNPQQVKTKLRHWAQAVACSVMQSSN
ncbi:uncharacterized protein LOC132301267 [Cornus florida]|uniref:uncharacterized protein LOC132301267 n=1 Tax=Cornus florida TaxID=4283 RepID=UPI00289CA84D|nr:uncharacterized protein LOC132301267 [Cornus florida]